MDYNECNLYHVFFMSIGKRSGGIFWGSINVTSRWIREREDDNQMNDQKKAYLAAALYVCITGFAFLYVKIALTVSSPMDTLAYRFTIAFVAATILLVFRKEQVKITRKDVFAIFPFALLYPTLFFTFQVFGLVNTSSSEAGIVQATIPIFTVVLAAIMLKEYANAWQVFSIILSVAGVVFIFIMNAKGSTYSLKGAGFILLSALATAFYNVLARKLTMRYSLFTLTYVMTFFGFITFTSISIITHLIEKSVTAIFLPFSSREFVISVVYLGVLSSLSTFFLSNYALSILEASKMSVFSNISTLITIIAGVIFLHESIQLYHIIGTIAIVAGVAGTNYGGKKKRNQVYAVSKSR